MKMTQRLNRRMEEATKHDLFIETMRIYAKEIQVEKTRRDSSRNGFIKTCAQQEIDQLTAEMNYIEERA